MAVCNTNRLNCTPAEALAATAIPSCGKLVNPDNLQAEQLIFDQAFNDLINNYGIPVNYYINTFSLSSADLLYGEDLVKSFAGPVSAIQMYIELSDDAVNLSKFGFDPGDEFTAFVHISTFYDAVSGLSASGGFDPSTVGQLIEPKAGDVIDIDILGCDRIGGRGGVMYEINPLLGHYIWRLRGKRFNYSFEAGLSADGRPGSEKANEQIYDNSINGILSTTLTDQVSSAQKTYPTTPAGEYDIDEVSQDDVLNMDINDTDIYGSYY